ncbi:YciI family protein [Aestuariibacter halophilus]|uniref:YciI family protein n=1 Tax=Fluctibacter halophilus TaxID=226011 RepID=A0ABS8GBD6_9ALTE|nr:YciI family protein [Aestuariibacter halophilus]MCC2616531.1 YciI family protein [Aestuariibacter halophilus]
MNEYMLIYQGGDPDWAENTSPEEMGAIMGRWEAWMGKLAAADKLANGGAPLHYAGKRVTPDGVVTDIAASEFKELVSGYSVVKAGSLEEACELVKDCPIMEYPDVTVEVRQIQTLE